MQSKNGILCESSRVIKTYRELPVDNYETWQEVGIYNKKIGKMFMYNIEK